MRWVSCQDAAESASKATVETYERKLEELREEIEDYDQAEEAIAEVVESHKETINELTNETARLGRALDAAKRAADESARAAAAAQEELETLRAAGGGHAGAGAGGDGEEAELLRVQLADMKHTLEEKQLEWQRSLSAKMDTVMELREIVEALTAAGPSSAGGAAAGRGSNSKELKAARVELEQLRDSKRRLEEQLAEVEAKFISTRTQLGELRFQKDEHEISAKETIKKLERKIAKLEAAK